MKKAEEIAQRLQTLLDGRKARSEAKWEKFYGDVVIQIQTCVGDCESFVKSILNIDHTLYDGQYITGRIVERLKQEGFVDPSVNKTDGNRWTIEFDIPIEAVKNRRHLSETR